MLVNISQNTKYSTGSIQKMNFFGRELNVYKANLHTHSTVSDGKYTPQEVIEHYAAQGYDVLAFTDHRKTNPVSTYDGKGMTLLSGIELHPHIMEPREIHWHLLSLGVPEDFPYGDDSNFKTAQEAVDAVNAAGGMVFCAHPYWCGLTSLDVKNNLKNILGIEVFNSSCRYIGREFNMQSWDELLEAGCRYNALAVDDVHSQSDLFGGYTCILAENKEPQSLLNAIRKGDFYASMGPEFKKITFENGILEAEFSPCVKVNVLANASSGYCASWDNYLHPENPEEYTSLKKDFSQWKNCYIRIQIQDKNGKYAWSNPIWL